MLARDSTTLAIRRGYMALVCYIKIIVRFGCLSDLSQPQSGLTGYGLGQLRFVTRILGPHVRVAADAGHHHAAPHILGYIVAWAILTLAWHVGHLQWPSRRKKWRFGGLNGVGRAQNSRVFGTHPEGSVCGGKCFATVAKHLPPVNSSTSRFLQREIIFFKGYSTFFAGVRKYHYPPVSRKLSRLTSKLRTVSSDSLWASSPP
jgi:hypothetical protein